MRLLPRVVGSGPSRRARGLLGAALALAAATAVAGCSRFDASLSQQQAIVTFRSGSTVTQRMNVRAACGKLPNVTPPPLPADLKSPYALQPLVYRIDHASDADVATLEKCLARYPSVAGITLQDSSDTGG
jgi:hypothetical protein